MGAPRTLEPFFEKDLFSQTRPVFESVALETEPSMISALTENYPHLVSSVTHLSTPLPKPINSEISKIQTLQSGFIFKRIALVKSKMSANDLESHLCFVNENREPGDLKFPRLYQSKQGRFVIESEGMLCYLMEDFDRSQYAGEDGDALLKIILQMGRMFRYFEKKPMPHHLFPPRVYFSSEDEIIFESLVQSLEDGTVDRDGSIGRQVRQYGSMFVEKYQESRSLFYRKKWHELPRRLVHIDLHPHNILVRPDGSICFLDFESLRAANPYACLGYAIFKLIRNAVALRGAAITEMEGIRLRNHFLQCLLESAELNLEDVSLLKLGAQVENITRFLTILKNAETRARWGDRLPMFGKALAGEIDYVFEPSL